MKCNHLHNHSSILYVTTEIATAIKQQQQTQRATITTANN
jgi:hypothetical protein